MSRRDYLIIVLAVLFFLLLLFPFLARASAAPAPSS